MGYFGKPIKKKGIQKSKNPEKKTPNIHGFCDPGWWWPFPPFATKAQPVACCTEQSLVGEKPSGFRFSSFGGGLGAITTWHVWNPVDNGINYHIKSQVV